MVIQRYSLNVMGIQRNSLKRLLIKRYPFALTISLELMLAVSAIAIFYRRFNSLSKEPAASSAVTSKQRNPLFEIEAAYVQRNVDVILKRRENRDNNVSTTEKTTAGLFSSILSRCG